MTPFLLRHNSGSIAGDVSISANTAVEVATGYAVLAGYSHPAITKTDYLGATEWQLTDSTAVWGGLVARPGGGVLYVGSACLYGIDEDGTVAWTSWPDATVPSNPAITAYSASQCFLNGASGNLLYINSVDGNGTVSYQKLYTGETNELTAFATKFLINGSDLFFASAVTTGDDYVKLTKLNGSLGVVWANSYKVTGSVMTIIDRCILSSGRVVIAYLVGSPTTTLRLVAIDPSGAVAWSKSVTDSAVTNYDTGWVSLTSGANGFFVQAISSAGDVLLYAFDASGSLSFGRKVKNPDYSGGAYGYSAFNTSDGGIMFGLDMVDSGSHTVAAFFKLRSDGTILGEYASGTADVSAHTTASVASGATVTAAATTAGTMGASTTPATLTPANALSATEYALNVYTNDLFQPAQASGHKAIHHGQASSPYLQSGQATGTAETKHGIAMSVTRVPSGATICASVGTKVAHHGQAVGVSSLTSAATGHLATRHGTAQCKTSYAATGTLSIAHGTASFSSLFQATGYRATKHGIATTLLSRAMTGHRAIKHGTMDSEWKATGQMTGHLATPHGAASSKCVFRAMPSFKTRHGTHKTIRSITC